MRLPNAALLALLALAPSLVRAGGVALPDLVPLIDDDFYPTSVERNADVHPADVAEGCAGAAAGRTLLHFTASTVNEGAADLVLGDPQCPDCQLFPGPTCANELFECSPVAGHGHPHFTKYALYEVLPEPGAPAAASGHKQSFCLEDSICGTRTYTCEMQGLTAGCKDVYPPHVLGCQYVDVTGLPGGRYLLRLTVNYEHILPESSYDNNATERVVEVCEGVVGPKVRFKSSRKQPGTVSWRIKQRAAALPPLVDRDPFEDGATARLEIDGATIVDVAIPGRPGEGHCGPKDGWKKDPRSGWSTYHNESGFLDRDCTVPAGGLRSLKIKSRTVTRDGRTYARLYYAATGKAAVAMPVQRVRATIGVGVETGPCWTGAASCSGHRCTPDSAGGAFTD